MGEVQQSYDRHQVIAMDAEEAEKRNISDMESLEREEPGLAKAVQDFFRLYKVVLYSVIYGAHNYIDNETFWIRCHLARERISLDLMVRCRTNSLPMR